MTLVWAVVILAVLASGAWAQAERPDAKTGNNSLRAGSWAVQFRIDDDFILSSFQGAIVSLKHHRSDRSAFRLGIGLDFNTTDNDENLVTTYNDSLTSDSRIEQNTNRQMIQLVLQYVRYPNPDSRLNWFFGVGPIVSFERSYAESVTPTSLSSNETTTWGTGIGGQLGVEWFATKNLSLHAEYGCELVYRWSDVENTSRSGPASRTRTADRNIWDFSPDLVLFGLSAYF